ncbi:hypothetical protein Tco_1073801 [Tanacetum coccineum]
MLNILRLEVTTERPKRPCIKRAAAVIGGESPSLLASCILSAKASVLAIPTLPFVTSSVSATLESEGGAPLDSVTRANLRTIGRPVRFVISLDSSHHSSTNASGAVVDYVISQTLAAGFLPPSRKKKLSLGFLGGEVDYEESS